MLSLPDMQEKQLLFVQADWGEKTILRFLNDNLVFEKGDKVANRASLHKALVVFVMGDTCLTTPLLRASQEHGVSLYFLKQNFEPYASFVAEAEGHWVLRQKQYACTDAQAFEQAKNLVAQKAINQTALLNVAQLLQGDPRTHKAQIRKKIASIQTPKELLGVEGNHTKMFFQTYFADIGWRRRAPRTKEDIPNLLLDIGYTLLFNLTDSLLRLHGFDTYKGVYHTLFFARRSLACDVMEPCRSIVEKQLAKSYALGQIAEKDFQVKNGAYVLPFTHSKKYTRIFSETLMERKEEVYAFVHGYYRHVMNPEQNPFPIFKL